MNDSGSKASRWRALSGLRATWLMALSLGGSLAGACVTEEPQNPSVEEPSAHPNGAGICLGPGPTNESTCIGQPADASQTDPHPAPGAYAGDGAHGRDLFFGEAFGTNGRTCGTCHGTSTGTISPSDIEARFQANPSDPLFNPIDSDGGAGASYSRLRTRATIRVHIPLPPNIVLADDPTAREIVLNRAVPTMFNTPAIDPLLMADGRETDPVVQGTDAVFAHFQPLTAPASSDMTAVADFERTLFTNAALASFAAGGPPPDLPQGTTDLEKEGRDFFVVQPFNPLAPKKGLCATCHGGPRLDTIANNINLVIASSGSAAPLVGQLVQPGGRFQNTFVSTFNGAVEGNAGLNPARNFVITDTDGTTSVWSTPDPGRALITGRSADVNLFRIPTLWGIKNTAPYFHDNSALTLEDVATHYQVFFAGAGPAAIGTAIVFTDEDKAALVAYMKLL